MSHNRRFRRANNIQTGVHIISPRMINGLICLSLLPALFLATVAVGADTNSLAQSFAARLEKACAGKKTDDRLNALSEMGKTLTLSEIPEAIKAAESLRELRGRVVLTESALKRWGELAPAEAFARISEMPEGVEKTETLRSVVPCYARKDIHAAVNAAVKMEPGRSRTETVSPASSSSRAQARPAMRI